MVQKYVGRRFIVTGGFGFLGRAVAASLSRDGAKVALVDFAPVPADIAGVPHVVAAGGVDLGDNVQAAIAFAAAARELGGIDGLVNVAGGFAWESVAAGLLETWDRMYAVNLRTAVASCQAVLPHLMAQGGGRIVNVGALAALKAGDGMGAYAASKAGVARLTEALAEEFKDRGITVNAVLPSIIDTPANRLDMPQADTTRWVAPAALAAVISFLLSDDAAMVTGACLPVSGRV